MEPTRTPPTTRADRDGLKTLVVFVQPELSRRIKIAAATHESTVQHIGQLALLEWLERYESGGEKTLNTNKSADLRPKGSRTLSSEKADLPTRKAAR